MYVAMKLYGKDLILVLLAYITKQFGRLSFFRIVLRQYFSKFACPIPCGFHSMALYVFDNQFLFVMFVQANDLYFSYFFFFATVVRYWFPDIKTVSESSIKGCFYWSPTIFNMCIRMWTKHVLVIE